MQINHLYSILLYSILYTPMMRILRQNMMTLQLCKISKPWKNLTVPVFYTTLQVNFIMILIVKYWQIFWTYKVWIVAETDKSIPEVHNLVSTHVSHGLQKKQTSKKLLAWKAMIPCIKFIVTPFLWKEETKAVLFLSFFLSLSSRKRAGHNKQVNNSNNTQQTSKQ